MKHTMKSALVSGSVITLAALTLAVSMMLPSPLRAAENIQTDPTEVQFKSELIDGVKVAYREAGDPNRSTVLLLHGFPTSSQRLIPLKPVALYVDLPLRLVERASCVWPG